MGRNGDEEIDFRCVRDCGSRRREGGERGRGRGRREEGGAEAGQIVARFDEFVEEVIIGGWIWEEGVSCCDGEGETGEKRVKKGGAEGGVLGDEVGGVSS